MRPFKDICFVRSAGFTLIELMVALILLSLVFLMLTSSLQFGTKVWSTRESDSSEILTAQDLLRRILSETRPVMIEADRSHARHVFFVGNENSIRFVASMPGHLGIGGFYEVLIYLTEGDPGRVEMSWRLFRAAEASSGLQYQHVALISRANQIQFAYFGSRGENESARWYNDWQDLDHLPGLIRMRVTFTDGDHVWPDLVVAPMVRSLDLR
jgi:prepilin-type N-terminal cleavage/methylation domain-containing protein